jgi:hypothetical protein
MKTTFYFLFNYIILSIGLFSVAQEIQSPFIVSPLIGDTLSLEERDYYNLLPTFNGFQFASFCLNADSLLDVRVSYKTRYGIRDTLINNYKSLANMRIYLFKVDIEMARKVALYTINQNTVSGNLVTISNSSTLLYNEDCNGNNFNANCITRINNTDINKLIIEGESDIGMTTLWGTLIGLGVGPAIGAISGAIYDDNDLSIGMGAAYGLVIGPIVGLFGGLIYGAVTSTPDIIIEPFSEDDIKGLSVYSIYPQGEPDELKKIK